MDSTVVPSSGAPALSVSARRHSAGAPSTALLMVPNVAFELPGWTAFLRQPRPPSRPRDRLNADQELRHMRSSRQRLKWTDASALTELAEAIDSPTAKRTASSTRRSKP